MKAVILAAGKGTRICDYTLGEPKSLVKIKGMTLLERSLRAIINLGIKNIDIIVGHKKESLIYSIENNSFFKNCNFIFNDKFETTGTAYSLWTGIRRNYNEDILVLEADVIFEFELIRNFLHKSCNGNATLVEKFNPSLDGSFVELDNQSFVLDWTHKNMRAEKEPVSHLFKTINIHRFTSRFLSDTLSPIFEENQDLISSENISLEWIFRSLVKKHPNKIKAIDNNQEFLWHEIDDLNDLLLAQKKFFLLDSHSEQQLSPKTVGLMIENKPKLNMRKKS